MSKAENNLALREWRKKVAQIREKTHLESYGTPKERAERTTRAKADYEYFVGHYLPTFATVKTPDFHIRTANRVRRNSELSDWWKWGRGLAKSVLADVTVPLWLWINNDIKFMLLIGQEETKAGLLLEDLRAQFEGNERLIHDFGPQKTVGQWEKGFFVTQNGFIAKAIGMGQEPRGLRVGAFRPDYIVCDDWETKETEKNPKRQDEYATWLLSSILPVMDGERQRVILAQNHFSPRMIFSKIIEENSGWKVIRVDAYDQETLLPRWREKYPDDYYKKKIERMGSILARAEYNNEPHKVGKIFTDELIQWAPIPRLNSFDAIIGIWDVAFSDSNKADTNAIRVWGIKDGKKYLIDCFVKHCRVRVALQWIADYQINLPKSVSVPFRFERQFWNQEILDTIEAIETENNILLNLSKMDRSTDNKFSRILTMHPEYQNGKIYYNEKLKNHNDTKEGLVQLKGIEPGYKSHDDAPDADKYAFDYLNQFKSRSKSLGHAAMVHRQTQKY